MRPNLLFLYTDEQRSDTLHAYGNTHIAMPNLDRLARQSCVFDRAYVTQPVCTPSRSSILTGLYPHTSGCTHNNIPLDYDVPCLPEMLPGGYATGHFGKWHLGDELYPQHGFESWVSIEDQYNAHFREGRDRSRVSDYSRWLIQKGFSPRNGRAFDRTEAARLPEEFSKPAFLAEQSVRFLRENRNNPYCLFVNFLEPHMPFTGPRDRQYDPETVPLPGNYNCPPTEKNHPRYQIFHKSYASGRRFGTATSDPDAMRRLIARYYGLCSQVDAHCGTILDALKEFGLWDSTIVVFTSDHGDMMGSHQLVAKCTMYEEAVRVPMLIKPPGAERESRFETPVSQVDIVPTLLEMMEQDAPGHLEGRSLASAVSSDSGPAPDEVVIEWNGSNNGLGSDDPARTDIPDDLLRIATREEIAAAVSDRLRTVISSDGRWKLNLSPMGRHELFDRETDPLECENVFGRPGTGEVTARLAERIAHWQQETGDSVKLPQIDGAG